MRPRTGPGSSAWFAPLFLVILQICLGALVRGSIDLAAERLPDRRGLPYWKGGASLGICLTFALLEMFGESEGILDPYLDTALEEIRDMAVKKG